MAFFSDTLNSVRSLASGFGFTQELSPVPLTAQQEAAPERNPEAQALFDIKKDLLTQIRAALPEGERPTLEQYRLACEAHAETEQGKAMVERGEWGPKVYADLSGQDLSGFTLSEPKKVAAQSHHLDQQPEEKEEQKNRHADTVDIHDRDGDGQINSAPIHEFFDNVRFDKADLHGAWVEPATSFNEEIAKAGNLKDLTFSGMQEGDKFTFGAGNYQNAHMVNVNGGEIDFGAHSHVEGISIEGKEAKISIGAHATVDHIEVGDKFRIIELNMGKNSVISNSDLGASTVSMTSHFEPGATFQNVQLSGNLNGLDFSGLKLNNVSIDGKPIIKESDLDQFGIKHEGTSVSASKDMVQQHELAQIRATMQGAVASIGTKAPAAEMGAPEVAIAARTESGPSGIIFSGEAHHDEITMNTKVASMERTVPVTEQASGANMQRSTNGQA